MTPVFCPNCKYHFQEPPNEFGTCSECGYHELESCMWSQYVWNLHSINRTDDVHEFAVEIEAEEKKVANYVILMTGKKDSPEIWAAANENIAKTVKDFEAGLKL